MLKILLLLLSSEVRTAKVDLTGGQRERHDRFFKSGGGRNNKNDAWEGEEGIFRTADLEIVIYLAIQTQKLRLNPDS